MKALLDNLKTNFLEKLPPRISETLKESIKHSERNEFTQSLQSLSESVIDLLRDEYYIPSGLVWNKGMGVVEMIRELRKAGKDLGKSETDAILRIQEKAKLEEIDSVVLESCFQGALEVFESFLLEKGNRVKKRVEATEKKSPGRFLLRELDTLLVESDTEEKIKVHFGKIEEIYRDFPYDKEVRKIYYLFLSHVDRERAKREILGYLEGGDVTIHLGAVGISLLAEMGFFYDAKKKLGWYDEEYSGEVDGKYAELLVYLFSYLKDGRKGDRQIVENLSDIIGQRDDSYYNYIEHCFMIFSERGESIQQKSEGLYLYKENQFKEKMIQSKKDRQTEKELQELQKRESAKKSEEATKSIQRKEESKTDEKIQIEENKPSTSETKLEKTFTNSIGMEFILIPAGEFLMGAVPQNKVAYDNEKPQHKVRITKPFYIGKYPVTQQEWHKVMGNNPSEFREISEGIFFKAVRQINLKNPVESVSWHDCHEFIIKLSQKEGKKYRLPTEAEWEYAARGTADSTTIFFVYTFGDDPSLLGDYAWYDENSESTTHPVGKKKPNSWGLYDMMGNVWEWCEDWYDREYYKKSPESDPRGISNGSERGTRGGSWSDTSRYCHTSLRGRNNPNSRGSNLGFRIAWTP
jgi:formylglycine-generating enzyme required for sulfatase activity